MSDHDSSVFKNSCLKVPRLPHSNEPLPIYEQKVLNQLSNEVRKLSIDSGKSVLTAQRDKTTMKSFIKFFDSIPDYCEMGHLSNKEFYRRLENMRERHRAYSDQLKSEESARFRCKSWIEDYKNLSIGKNTPKKSSLKPVCSTPSKSPAVGLKTPDEFESYFSDTTTNKPPSRRSVRIESPKSTDCDGSPDINYFRSKSRFGESCNESVVDDLTPEDLKILNSEREFDTLVTRSLPSSPSKCKQHVVWKDPGITIPKPFQMTVRDEEDKIVDDILQKRVKPEKCEMFRANPIPLESQIPLYDKIVADQNKRRKVVKKRRKAALESQMRPFSFTRREEELRELTKRLSRSTPTLAYEERPIKVKRFRAKPVPKNLFSNYVYQKMYDDEFYRTLQKKVRAEEMLKASAMPPSMAKRERFLKAYGYVYPRPCRTADEMDADYLNDAKMRQIRLESELEELEAQFGRVNLTDSKKKKKKIRKSKSSTRCSSAATTTMNIDCINRTNFASVLRVQSARRKMENEMSQRLIEARNREEARWRERIIRKRPVWQQLAYDHEEDLASRLEMRREEERLRAEEHHMRMRNMQCRVQKQPYLFERTIGSHHGGDIKTREDLILTRLYGIQDSSVTSESTTETAARVAQLKEMKDEAVQAEFNELVKNEEMDALSGN